MQSPESLRQSFYLLIILIGLTSIGVAWLVFRSTQSKSGFKLREADRRSPREPRTEMDGKKTTPLLTGLRIDGPAHEILGIAPEATAADIQAAYLGLIKRFHPDKVGPPGSREWKDAQKIAAALNEARNQMLERLEKS